MNRHFATVMTLVVMLFAPRAAMSQATTPIYSETRNAALGYIATANFLVGRIGGNCLAILGRSESPQDFARAWQQRNAKYVVAAAKYMEKVLEEALAAGGTERRDAILRGYTSTARANADATFQGWLQSAPKEEVCKRSVALVDSGTMDISAKSPMFRELEALASWAQ